MPQTEYPRYWRTERVHAELHALKQRGDMLRVVRAVKNTMLRGEKFRRAVRASPEMAHLPLHLHVQFFQKLDEAERRQALRDLQE